MQPPVILVIPAWDEAESIGAVLREVPPELVGEVVVFLDGDYADPRYEAYRAFRERLYSSDPPASCRNCGVAWSL